MKKFLLIISIISMAAISCADNNGAGGATESTVSKNIPSMSKQTLTGTPNTQQSLALSVSSQAANQQASGNITTDNVQEVTSGETGYNLLERLYDTAWVSVESGWDDGRPETEETYIFFNSDSEMVEREYENGVLDGRDDYSTLKWISDIQVDSGVGSGNTVDGTMPLPVAGTDYSRNACIVQNMEKGDRDTDYEIYFMTGEGNERVLYVVDGDDQREAFKEFQQLLVDIANTRVDSDKRFVLAKAAK
ncbi:hypothetical protein [Brachyspira pilosicoli]|uniref:hypothetical protein n=1 Tax=Brachyspira pilosicoli TaxID=52584 RepID=UPI001CA48601|nr:hypothetical protein [Brachyspira pilosicoli]MBW5382020.1 hypothetical protein [Brachyspira pilosicoli]